MLFSSPRVDKCFHASTKRWSGVSQAHGVMVETICCQSCHDSELCTFFSKFREATQHRDLGCPKGGCQMPVMPALHRSKSPCRSHEAAVLTTRRLAQKHGGNLAKLSANSHTYHGDLYFRPA